MTDQKAYSILSFLKEEIKYFQTKSKGVTFEQFVANKDLRKILNATLNELVLALVDLAGECLRKTERRVPTTYKEILLTTKEIVGDIAVKAAPLAKLRNETIHEYMNVNWKNIQFLRTKGLRIIKEYVSRAEGLLKN
ncbi:MAG: DUF86 domain-containing protein [Candidatus Tectomicrobia bacterium]|uniref:DUF86 domain-containing protein n=1 Tax=Tectimicrobiota bacterium TaxID=2528274 RepID=A0A933LQ43_UNCTE|nr:DUF86 domain-containing protein [Candidatus Tectomicrobia bacterium]